MPRTEYVLYVSGVDSRSLILIKGRKTRLLLLFDVNIWYTSVINTDQLALISANVLFADFHVCLQVMLLLEFICYCSVTMLQYVCWHV